MILTDVEITDENLIQEIIKLDQDYADREKGDPIYIMLEVVTENQEVTLSDEYNRIHEFIEEEIIDIFLTDIYGELKGIPKGVKNEILLLI